MCCHIDHLKIVKEFRCYAYVGIIALGLRLTGDILEALSSGWFSLAIMIPIIGFSILPNYVIFKCTHSFSTRF